MNRENSKSLPYIILFAWSLVFVMLSFVYINTGDFIHDYPFHLGRIAGLAQSLAHGDFLPDLNFAFVRGMGYGVPMFYGSWLLYLPALVYLIAPNAQLAYSVLVLCIVYGLAASLYFAIHAIGRCPKKALAAAITGTLVFTWFGYGMTMAALFVPLLVWCLYKVIFKAWLNPVLLGIVIALLIQTHILSTLVLAFLAALFVLINLKKMTLPKWGSFVFSIAIGLILSTGFLVQYKIQSESQVFFFDWMARDYPFASESLLNAKPLWTLVESYSDPVILAVLAALAVQWKKLSRFCRQLVLVSILLFVIQSSLLPWHDVLRFTPLALIQDARRIAFFIPVLVLMAAALSWSFKANAVIAGVQLAFYIATGLLAFLPGRENIDLMTRYDQRARMAQIEPESYSFDPSGDEYFTVDFIHSDKNKPELSQFQALDNLEISNVESGYNVLEFDCTLVDKSKPASLIVPRFWYEGYTAQYSQGASGSQPALKTRPLNEEEKERAQAALKPDTETRGEYDGKIYLEIESGGHVKITFKKSQAAIAGFILEGIGWVLLGGYLLVFWHDQKRLRRQKFRLAIIQVRNREMDQVRRQMELDRQLEQARQAGEIFAWPETPGASAPASGQEEPAIQEQAGKSENGQDPIQTENQNQPGNFSLHPVLMLPAPCTKPEKPLPSANDHPAPDSTQDPGQND